MLRKDKENLISNNQRRLQKLKETQALQGPRTPPETLLEIEDTEATIKELQAKLHALDDKQPPKSTSIPAKNSEPQQTTTPLVFISYSHRDEEEKEMLVTHLNLFKRANLIDLWVDDQIEAGADWKAETEKAMSQASVAILLISANFLNSDSIWSNQVPVLLKRHKQEELTIFPIIVRKCNWRIFDWLDTIIQPDSYYDKPIWSGTESQIDTDLAKIADEVAEIVKKKSL